MSFSLLQELVALQESYQHTQDQTHVINAALKKREVSAIKREVIDFELKTVTVVPNPGGHNSGDGSSYYQIFGSESDLKEVCSFSADKYGYFDESDIEKV